MWKLDRHLFYLPSGTASREQGTTILNPCGFKHVLGDLFYCFIFPLKHIFCVWWFLCILKTIIFMWNCVSCLVQFAPPSYIAFGELPCQSRCECFKWGIWRDPRNSDLDVKRPQRRGDNAQRLHYFWHNLKALALCYNLLCAIIRPRSPECLVQGAHLLLTFLSGSGPNSFFSIWNFKMGGLARPSTLKFWGMKGHSVEGKTLKDFMTVGAPLEPYYFQVRIQEVRAWGLLSAWSSLPPSLHVSWILPILDRTLTTLDKHFVSKTAEPEGAPALNTM